MNPQQFNFLGNNMLQNFQNNTGGAISQASNESEKFPGLTKQQEAEITKKANQANVTESEKNYMLNDMYQQQLRRNQIDKFAEERENTKRQLLRRAVESKDIKTSKQSKQIEKKGDVADMIRKYVSATQEIDLNKLNKVSDDQIIADFTADNPDVAYAIDDFTKSQMSSQYFSEMMGFSQFEEQQDEGFFKNLLNSITYGVETGAKGLKGLIDKGLDTVEGNSNESSYSMENLTAFDNYIQHKYGVSGSQLRESDKEVWQQERNLVQDNPEVLKQYMTTVSEDALNFAEGYTDALFTATNPYMALGMKTVGAAEQEMGGGVLTWLGEKMGGVGSLINEIPGLRDYRETLSPEDQQRFDAFVGNVAVGLILGTKNKKNIVKDPKAFLMENLQPNQITKNFVQSVTGMPDKFFGATDSLAGGTKGLMTKVSKGVDNAGNVLDRAAEWGAKKITNTATAQDKLYKAQEPRMNILSEKKNLERKRINSDRANELILDNGYKPTNTSERLDAHQKTLNKLWGQVMDQVNAQEGINVDQSTMIDALSNYIKDKKKLGVAGVSSDIKALEAELKSLKKMQAEGNTDIPTLEAKKQVLNDLIDRKGQEASEVYKGGIKLLTQEIGKIEDSIISQIPGEFSELKRDVGALLDTYEDVFKADMKNQRKKGLGITETYSRIEGIGDTLGGIVKLFGGDASGLVKGLGKLALGKSLAKASDVDFLVKQGFEDLYNERLGGNKSQASSKTAKYQVAEEEIKPNATSPEELSHVNDEGLSVMDSFVSKKQELKAKNVSKDLLDSNGNPYLWTSTNKYRARVISDFRNVEDSKYKAFSDQGKEIAWFTNNADMSYSYADYKSILAPTKRFNSVEAVNKFFEENPNTYEKEFGNGGSLKSSQTYKIQKADNGYELIPESQEIVTQSMKDFYKDLNNDRFGNNIGDMPKNTTEALGKLQKYYEDNPYTDGEITVRLLDNGDVERVTIKTGEPVKQFETEQQAIAEGSTFGEYSEQYHYQGIIQDVKNPLVVDVKGEGNNPSLWNSLGNAGEFLRKNHKNYEAKFQNLKDKVGEALNERSSFSYGDLRKIWDAKDKAYEEYTKAKKEWVGDNTAMDKAMDDMNTIRDVRENIESMLFNRGGKPMELTEKQRNYKITDTKTLGNIYDEAVKLYKKYEDTFSLDFKNREQVTDYIAKYTDDTIAHMLRKNKLFDYEIDTIDGLRNHNLAYYIDDVDMTTNDYVFYALNDGRYDGVLFRNIKDYGGTPSVGWKDAKGGDVLAVFNSKQFKNRNNPDPTDSKYISYQKYGTAGKGEKGISAAEGLNIRNFKNGKTVQELANQYGIDTKIVDSISTPEGQRAYGMYGDRLITLSKDLKESTVPHELLHGVFDMVDSKRRTSILEGIQKNLNVDNVQAEEWLADNFSEYYRTGKFGTTGLAKGLVERVKQFFYEVKSYIDGTYKNEKQIRQLFDDIIDGKIEGEYGVYSDPKFQSVWHGSKADFERFDSTHMGEGEGAQAHGWGHYVAKDKATGEHYADMGKLPSTHYKGRAVESYYGSNIKPDEKVASSIAAKMDGGDTYKYAFNSTKNRLIEYIKEFEDMDKNGSWEDEGYTAENGRKRLQSYREELESMDNIKESDFTMGKNKHLYEVEIPDPIKKDTPTGSNYLEEDGKITKIQLNKIADALEDYTPERVIDKGEDLPRLSKDAEKQMADRAKESALYRLRNTELDGAETYRALVDILGSDKAASKFLESLGYDGIHYFGGRDGEAYVIFNDDALEITKHHKY